MRGRPPGLAGGISGSRSRNWSSVRAWPEPKSPTDARSANVHMAASRQETARNAARRARINPSNQSRHPSQTGSKRCAEAGFDLVVAADEPAIHDAAAELRGLGATADAVEADLSTTEGVDRLYAAIGGRPVEALLANAGLGLGHGFLDQDFAGVRKVVDTNITGTIYLVQKIGRDM